jgi:ferric enterobactin receptor
MVRLNFSYRFGKMDVSLFKRQNMKSQGEGMQGATQGMQ